MSQIATTDRGQAGNIALPNAGAPARIGQATAVEQSRAQSEVYFRVRLAHDVPRNEEDAYQRMQTACGRYRLAEKAFYKLPRSGGTVEGPSVHLARELARIWGNIDYGVQELRQDDEYGQSEIQAFAWDLQTNARSAQTFIVPHKKDAGGRVKKLEKMQEIFENNANVGARRLREAIFNVLPHDFITEAQEICRATLSTGDGKPLEERIAGAIAAFKKDFGVTEEQLATKVGRESRRWDAEDVAHLLVTYKSLKAREVTKEQEFPAAEQKVTADELVGGGDRADEQRDLEAEEGNL
jgi:hypothetical protein